MENQPINPHFQEIQKDDHMSVSEKKPLEITCNIDGNINAVGNHKLDPSLHPSVGSPVKRAKNETLPTILPCQSHTISCEGGGGDHSKSSVGLDGNSSHMPTSEEVEYISRPLDSNFTEVYFETPSRLKGLVPDMQHRLSHNSSVFVCYQSFEIDEPIFFRNDSEENNFYQNEASSSPKLPETYVFSDSKGLSEECLGSGSNNNTQSTLMFSQLTQIFPDMDRNVIMQFCNIGMNLDQTIDAILQSNDNTKLTHHNLTDTIGSCNSSKQIDSNYTSDKSLPSAFSAVTFPSTSSAASPPPSSAPTYASTCNAEDIKSLGCENKLKPCTITKPTEGLITETLNESATFKISQVTNFDNGTQTEAPSVICQLNYKTKEDSQLEYLLKIFPDADHQFLEEKSKLGESELKTFVSEVFENKDYPKLVTPIMQKENIDYVNNHLGVYTTSFNVEKFLKILSDPFKYFLGERNCQFSEHGLQFLKRRYGRQSMAVINKYYSQCKFNIARTCERLDAVKRFTRKTNRDATEITMPSNINLPFLQEACFVEHKEEIKAHIDYIAKVRREAYDQAKARGELIKCNCCYEELLFEECAHCNEGDLFCKECIKKGTEVRVGDGLTTFPCLLNCGAEFSLQLLQTLLDARVFSSLLKRVQMAEVNAAEIEGLEMCPFCEFASIPPPETSVFVCLNPECLKESCRNCHKISHIPLHCDEVENDDQARARKFIEDEMTKALVRECYKCHKPFIKEHGCNKMTCSCGATMCYVCRKPVMPTNYDHFVESPSKTDNKCPVFSTDNSLHVDAVKKRAESALQEVTEKNPGLSLMHDPTLVLPEEVSDYEEEEAEEEEAEEEENT